MRLEAAIIALSCAISGSEAAQAIASADNAAPQERQAVADAKRTAAEAPAGSAAIVKPAPVRKVRVILSSPYASSAE